MQKGSRILKRTAALLFAVFLLQAGAKQVPRVLPVLETAALFSAGDLMPEGAIEYLKTAAFELPHSDSENTGNIPSSLINSSENQQYAPPQNSADPNDPNEQIATGGDPTPSQPPSDPKYGKIAEVRLRGKGSGVNGVWITNLTKNHTDINISSLLKKKLDMKIEKNGKPQVLIFHTHTTESYEMKDSGYYVKSASMRTRDPDKSVVRVGEAIAEQLRAANIGVIHDTTIHDDPNFSGAYTASAKTVSAILKKYPSIKIVIDVHRDSIQKDENTRLKPTATINGKKAAQVMLLASCDDDGKRNHPNWESNFALSLKVSQAIEKMYPGLTRPVYFKNGRFNHHLSKGAILLEMGSDGNTLEEAVYAGELVGKSLVPFLENLK